MENSTIILQELLNKNLTIPEYQRPYEWSKKNAFVLLNDILERYNNKEEDNRINLGAIIILEKDGKLNIVDGQQRIITLALLLKVLGENDLKILNENILCTKKSINRIKDNYNSLNEYIEILKKQDNLESPKFKKYLNEKVYFYIIKTNSTEESFQLFDGRNAKYIDLTPADLLKAYHLGVIKSKSKKKQILADWNKNINAKFKVGDFYIDKKTNKIDYLYNNVLFRIYNWSMNKDALDLTKEDIYLYKGYKKNSKYNYVKYYKNIDKRKFQINKPFENGEGFFDMTNHYIKEYDGLLKKYGQTEKLKEIYSDNNYYKLYYTNNLYYNALLLYNDRFGKIDSSIYDEIISDYIYKWSFTHRIKHDTVNFTSVNHYVVHKNNNFFFSCNRALDISELLSLEVEDKGKNPKKAKKASELRSKIWKQVI